MILNESITVEALLKFWVENKVLNNKKCNYTIEPLYYKDLQLITMKIKIKEP